MNNFSPQFISINCQEESEMKKAISGILLDSTPNSPDLNHKKNAWQTVMRIDDKILGVKGLGILMQQPRADNFFYSH